MVRIPYRYPPPGTDAVADAIRARRGPARGLTPLDGTLLNSPPLASGWNALLGAVRSQFTLPDDVREIMILRIAALNRAAFEWIQHEPVARAAGVTTEQLARVGDVSTPTRRQPTPLSASHLAALDLTDEMTKRVRVSDRTLAALRQSLAGSEDRATVEAVATVATYNMVSRFLVALDVDDRADAPVPVPFPESDRPHPPTDGASTVVPAPISVAVPAPSPSPSYLHECRLVDVGDNVRLAVRTRFRSTDSPWLLLVNSLLTNLTMWDRVLPDLSSRYNVVCYDQRGHGASDVPPHDCTVEALADDAAAVASALGLSRLHAVVGVSQGGATALALALRHPRLVERVVACDTQPASPAANVAAWEERISVARATPTGMEDLADATVERWFGAAAAAGSDVHDDDEARREEVRRMVATTDRVGFERGARALQRYDLVSQGIVARLAGVVDGGGAADGPLRTLLLAGERDGKLPETLRALDAEVRRAAAREEDARCRFVAIPRAGHLPMCQAPREWSRVVLDFLAE